MEFLIDHAARDRALGNGVPENLHVPVAAVDEDAIRKYIGEIQQELGRGSPARALLVKAKEPPPVDLRFPIWDLEGSKIFRERMQVPSIAGYAVPIRGFNNPIIRGARSPRTAEPLSERRPARSRKRVRPSVPSTYYIDESGNTGDLARQQGPDFDRQPIFVLACVGCDESEDLGKEIERLKAVYKIQAPELKSSSLVTKPDFITELAQFMHEQKYPLLVEVVDKRYYLVTNIVSLLILTPLGAEIDYAPDVRMMKNLFAEYLHHWMPEKVLDCFVASCDAPSAKNVQRMLNSLKSWLATRASDDQMAEAIIHFVRENIAELTSELRTDAQAYRRFLPDPDKSTRDMPVWLLPNLSSFANIYGRINVLHESKVGNVTLVHDEQRHFEHILRDGKTLAESLVERGGEFVLPHSDFRFIESAKLEFANSHASAGIQAADAIAGFVMRYVKAVLSLGRPDMAYRIAFDSLLRLSEPERSTGLNLVLSYADLERLGIREAN